MAEPRTTGTPVTTTVTTTPPRAPVAAVDDDRPPKSPATRTVRTMVAAAFVLVWTIVLIVDFFFVPEIDVIPLWFQATGLLVLGFLLGVSMEDIPGRGGGGGR